MTLMGLSESKEETPDPQILPKKCETFAAK